MIIEIKQSSILVKQTEELKKLLDEFFEADFIVEFDNGIVRFKTD